MDSSRSIQHSNPSSPKQSTAKQIDRSTPPLTRYTALDIKAALNNIKIFHPIGECPSQVRVGRKAALFQAHMGEEVSDSEEEDEEDEEDEDEEENEGEGEEDEDEVLRNNETLVAKLAKIYSKAPVQASGDLSGPFSLTIKREGCEFSGDIQPTTEYYELKSDKEEFLTNIFEHAAVSGYGDVRNQMTLLDTNVRNAREIAADEFSVEPELLKTIRDCWASRFRPRAVRVEPYKIHVYGPEGHFKTHRDTPELGLVGTFLLGLGDSTEEENLRVDTKEHPAFAGHWVAFYPDVPHRVLEVLGYGYRAVIAFKIFREDDADSDELSQDEELVREVRQVVKKIKAPFGLLMERKYCMGTQKLSGFDAVLQECFAKKDKVEVHLLPVVIVWKARMYGDKSMSRMNTAKATVYPFTSEHVDCLVATAGGFPSDEKVYFRERDPRKRIPAYDVVENNPGLAWLRDLEDVKFYAMDVKDATVMWDKKQQEEAEYTGNESRPYSEDSIYLSYALIIIPN